MYKNIKELVRVMSFDDFKKGIERLDSALSRGGKYNVNLKQKVELDSTFFDFSKRRIDYYQRTVDNSFDLIKKTLPSLNELISFDTTNELKVVEINKLMSKLEESYKKKDVESLKDIVGKIKNVMGQLNQPKKIESNFFRPRNIPEDIKKDVSADLEEMERCFNSGCYRSATILCGRILETVLHRKYYEITENDLLEKSPGMGLGKLVAKLNELNVSFDPGITQQIHLINQVRVFSVHKKKDVFYPSKSQAHAILLYTLDIVDKLF